METRAGLFRRGAAPLLQSAREHAQRRSIRTAAVRGYGGFLADGRREPRRPIRGDRVRPHLEEHAQGRFFADSHPGRVEFTAGAGNLAEEVNRLKAQPGGDMSVGGAELAGSFTQLGLIDEYWLYFHPVVLGGGKPMFAPPPPGWTCSSSKPTTSPPASSFSATSLQSRLCEARSLPASSHGASRPAPVRNLAGAGAAGDRGRPGDAGGSRCLAVHRRPGRAPPADGDLN